MPSIVYDGDDDEEDRPSTRSYCFWTNWILRKCIISPFMPFDHSQVENEEAKKKKKVCICLTLSWTDYRACMQI